MANELASAEVQSFIPSFNQSATVVTCGYRQFTLCTCQRVPP